MTKHPVKYILLCGAFVLSACQTIQIERPHIQRDEDWLVDGFRQDRSRSYENSLSLPLAQQWEYNAAAAFGPGSPLILNGFVLVANRKGEIHAINLETGRKNGYKSFGEGIEASPIIDDGNIYIASAIGKYMLQSQDLRNDAMKWRVRGTPIESGPVLALEFIVAADIQGVVQAFDKETGEVQWRRELGERISVQSSLVLVGEDRVFVADDAGQTWLLRAADGTVIWTRAIGGPIYEGVAALEDSGFLVIPTTRGTLVALSTATGEQLWSYSLPNTTVRFGSVALSATHVVVGATDGMVRALNPSTGSILWSRDVGDVVSAAPLIDKHWVYVGTMGRKLIALDVLDGSPEWETLMKGRIKSAMALTDKGLIVLSEPRYVTYFTSAGGGHEQNK